MGIGIDDREIAKRNQATLEKIQEWVTNDTGYDEKMWPVIQQRIEENRLSKRHRFHEEDHS